jgi:hypothetical protein
VLFGAELTPWAQQFFVVPWTNTLAAISAWIVTVVDPNVAATGKILRSTTNDFAVSIEAGCNGVEATIVLVAAMLFPVEEPPRRPRGRVLRAVLASHHPSPSRPVEHGIEWAHSTSGALIMLGV